MASAKKEPTEEKHAFGVDETTFFSNEPESEAAVQPASQGPPGAGTGAGIKSKRFACTRDEFLEDFEKVHVSRARNEVLLRQMKFPTAGRKPPRPAAGNDISASHGSAGAATSAGI